MAASSSRTFLITGISSGFGDAFARAALADGHVVVGTVRGEAARGAFEALAPGRAHAVMLDVTDFDAIEPVVAAVMQRVGPIDVLVNNAGYGHEGTLEESGLDAMRRQFDVNVFGAVAMTKAVLPSCRQCASAAAGISSTSLRWAASSRCPASRITAAASSRSKVFRKCWPRKSQASA